MFAVLFSWISFGFWTAVAGFWMLLRRVKEFTVADLYSEQRIPGRFSPARQCSCPYAMKMSLCFWRPEGSYRPLAATSELRHFDFYVLSDTSDPETEVEEEFAWAQTCRAVQGFGKIFYRHRRNNIRRKSGNIADFLRRWGRNYDYMIVFDADSVVAGTTLVRLAGIMDHHPEAGIVQTAPTTVNCDAFFGRVQQFASRAYGPMLAAGLRFWQLGESHYWGHNAIIRIAPFVKYCGLARLPGKPPLGAEILSHDFVEAAHGAGRLGRVGGARFGRQLRRITPHPCRRAQTRSPLVSRKFAAFALTRGDGIRGGHRAIFSMGVMAYASALLWFIFLLLNTADIALSLCFRPLTFHPNPVFSRSGPSGIPNGPSPFSAQPRCCCSAQASQLAIDFEKPRSASFRWAYFSLPKRCLGNFRLDFAGADPHVVSQQVRRTDLDGNANQMGPAMSD